MRTLRQGLAWGAVLVACTPPPPTTAPAPAASASAVGADVAPAACASTPPRVATLLDDGQLDRASRVLEAHLERCPKSDAGGQLLELLAALGDRERGERWAEVLGLPPPGVESPSAAELVAEAMGAPIASPEARRAWDRARVAFLAASSHDEEVVLLGPGEVQSLDERHVVMGVRHATKPGAWTAVFGRRPFVPQLLLPSRRVLWADEDHARVLWTEVVPPPNPRQRESTKVTLTSLGGRDLASAPAGEAWPFQVDGDRVLLDGDHALAGLKLPDLEPIPHVEGGWEISADGRVAVASEPRATKAGEALVARVFEVHTGKTLYEVHAPWPHDEGPLMGSLSDDGRFLVWHDPTRGVYRTLDFATKRERPLLETRPDEVVLHPPAFTADSRAVCMWAHLPPRSFEIPSHQPIRDGLCAATGDEFGLHAVIRRARPSRGFSLATRRDALGTGTVVHQFSHRHGVMVVAETRAMGGRQRLQLQLYDDEHDRSPRVIEVGDFAPDLLADLDLRVEDDPGWVIVDAVGLAFRLDDGSPADPADRWDTAPAAEDEGAEAPSPSGSPLPGARVALGRRSILWYGTGTTTVWSPARTTVATQAHAAAVSASGEWIALDAQGPQGDEIHVLKRDGTQRSTLSHAQAMTLAVGDGGTLLVVTPDTLEMWDARAGTRQWTQPIRNAFELTDLVMSDDGTMFAYRMGEYAQVFAVEDGARLATLRCRRELGWEGRQLLCDFRRLDPTPASGPPGRRGGMRPIAGAIVVDGQELPIWSDAPPSQPWSITLEGTLMTRRPFMNLQAVVMTNGAVTLIDPTRGHVVATLAPGTREAEPVALLDDGYLDPLGAEAKLPLLCRYGHRLAPGAVCSERWLAPGALAARLAGDTTYRRP